MALTALSLAPLMVGASTTSLGLDSGLNLLTFNDFVVSSSDVQGRVAVGGNAIIGGYSINTPSNHAGTALTVAGNLTVNGGTINGDTFVGKNLVTTGPTINGNVVVAGDATWYGGGKIVGNVTVGRSMTASNPTITGDTAVVGNLTFVDNGSVNGNVVVGGNMVTPGATIGGTLAVGGNLSVVNNGWLSDQGLTVSGSVSGLSEWNPHQPTKGAVSAPASVNPDPGFAFVAEKERLTTLSSRIGAQAASSAVYEYGDTSTLVLNATDADGINVFDISAADASKNFRIAGLTTGTIIINVSGSEVSLGGHGFTGFSGFEDQVLFNLNDATTLMLGSVAGSILAPKATVSGGQGVILGQVVVNNWNSNIQVNDVAFAGSIPGVTAPVPEPETYAMLLAGLGLMGFVARRRRQA